MTVRKCGPSRCCVRPLGQREALCGRHPTPLDQGEPETAVGDGSYLEHYRDRVTCPDCLTVLNPPPVVLEGQQALW